MHGIPCDQAVAGAYSLRTGLAPSYRKAKSTSIAVDFVGVPHISHNDNLVAVLMYAGLVEP